MLKAYAKDFWRYRYLLQNLIGRDFKLKYRRSVLGVVWSVLNPLLMNIFAPLIDYCIVQKNITARENRLKSTNN